MIADVADEQKPSARINGDAMRLPKFGLYRILEEHVVPAFYDRDDRQVPIRWVEIVREAMRSNLPRFSARRMVKQYVNEMYAPATQGMVRT